MCVDDAAGNFCTLTDSSISSCVTWAKSVRSASDRLSSQPDATRFAPLANLPCFVM